MEVCRWGAAVLAVSLVLTGCVSTSHGHDATWAADAETWLTAFVDARRTDAALMAPFLSPDITYDHACIEGFNRATRWDTVRSFDEFFDGGAEELSHGQPYVDPSGVAYATSVDLGASSPYTMLELLEVEDGAVSTMFHARAVHLDPGFAVADDSAAEALATRYVAAFGGNDPGAVVDLYAPDALVTDGLLDLTMIAHEDPRELLDQTPALTLDTMRRHHGRGASSLPDAAAVYAHRRHVTEFHPIDQVWLLAQSVDTCPGDMAIVLTVDESMTVTAERRMHGLASARQCVGATNLDGGWWDTAHAPRPFVDRVTGAVTTPAGTIEIRNGCPELEAAVRQAMRSFSSAGLGAPDVASITFDPYHPDCENRRGYSDWTAGDLDIHLCMDEDTVHWVAADADGEPDDARVAPMTAAAEWNLLLHELAHAWMRTHLTSGCRAEVVDVVAAASWNDHDDPWAERGIEWAAEALRWGLLGDADCTVVNLGSPDCATLAEVYAVVAGSPPLLTCDEPGAEDG